MRSTVTYALGAAAALMLVASLLSLLPSDAWYVRSVDLVREPLAWSAIILGVIALLAVRHWRWPLLVAFVLVAGINFVRIWPYNSIAGEQIALSGLPPGGECFTALAVNVKVKNTQAAPIIAQIERADPDILFLMETDAQWVRQLEPVLAGYDTVRSHPQPKAFGLVFATRLPTAKVNIVENTHRDTPTLYATLTPPGVAPIEFIGLHPKPPLPGWNTEMRDRNIIRAGLQTPDRLPDAVVMGDFNDVPWSRTTTRFREAGDWKDPRIGRGTFATFPSDWLWIGWPLDQVMAKGDIQFRSFDILPDNSSDHRAIRAEFCAPPAT
jgi:endonuclease/exonuclease/phosphatase (EEP) superfamily protein YafD